MRPIWKTIALAAAICTSCTAASAQIKIGHKQGTTTGGSTIGRGIVKKKTIADEKKAMEKGCLYHLGKAEEFFAQKRYAKACQKLRKANGLLVTRELAERAIGLAKKLNEAGGKEIARGDEAFEKKAYRQAVKIYRDTSLIFVGLPAAKTARQRLADAANDPDVADVVTEEKAAGLLRRVNGVLDRHRRRTAKPPAARATATTRPAAPVDDRSDVEVILALPDDDLLRVGELLERIAKECATTPTGQEVTGLLATLGADPKWSRRIGRVRSGQQARKDLAKADVYCNAGLLKKASAMYHEIIKKYPDSPQAKEAARQLGIIEVKLSGP